MPSYDGSGLVNLMAEIEGRLGGSPQVGGLTDSRTLADAATVVLVLFDGLGVAQLGHPDSEAFGPSFAGTLTCGFPSTTTVSLSTVATGLPPAQSGAVGHLTFYPELDKVVNTLKWIDLNGQTVPYDYPSVLPSRNLWERLRSAGVEPITVQPGGFQGSPLSRVLYRGARFEPAWDWPDLIEATISLAAEPRRFVFTYVPFVDVAGHSFGLESAEFTEALKVAASIWEGIIGGLPPGVTVVGTADHGLMEVAETNKVPVRGYEGMRFAGDARCLQVWGEGIAEMASDLGGTIIDGLSMLGPDPSAKTRLHLPEAFVLAPSGVGFYPPAFDRRLFAYHGD